ncbi:MAG: hypothetical protein JXB49_18000 [Bacteroidales bacterium]|nr:hypothetical protein [Bacteroidales bacterium]
MVQIRRILMILNLKTLIITGLSIVSTLLCLKYSIVAEFPLTIITIAIVFPIVFSIGGAYKRREVALSEYGSIKAHCRALYFVPRDWLEKPSQEVVKKTRDIIEVFLVSCRDLFTGKFKDLEENEKVVYENFSKLSIFIRDEFRKNDLPSGEVSRANQYLSKIMISFENTKHIYQYRTPRTLRAFSNIFISLLPILYGPYFAFIAKDFAVGLEYVIPVLFSATLVALDNIQAHLENPFDLIGEDDIRLNVDKFIASLN